MLARSTSLKSSKSSKSNKGKGKAVAKSAPKPKVSNRPRNSPSPAPSSNASDDDEEEEEDDATAERVRMLAALEAHQQSFLQEALPSTSKLLHAGKGKEKEEVKEQKAVWEMDMDDFDDEEAASEDDSEEEGEDQPTRRAPAQSITFTDPGRASSAATVVAFEEPRLGGESSGGAVGSRRDMRDFMSSKVKNSHKTLSMSDIVNAKHKGKARKSAATELGGEEEAHLSTLDGHLSTLLRPLISNPSGPATSQLPSLLSTLPLTPTKALKGHTPLPGNAPRTLRAGQSAKNLERALKRDEANGVVAGSKRGRVGEGAREALSLREKRREDAGGEVKRQRGLKGAVGRMGGGELRLSREEVERVNGGGAGGGGGRGVRGGGGGRGGRGKGRK